MKERDDVEGPGLGSGWLAEEEEVEELEADGVALEVEATGRDVREDDSDEIGDGGGLTASLGLVSPSRAVVRS